MNSNLTKLSEIVSSAADRIVKERPATVDSKALDDFVTNLDHELQANIFSKLKLQYPGIALLGEESLGENERLPSDCFVVDPLDGTSNWIAGIRFCGVSVARIVEGKTVDAAVLDAFSGTVYCAGAGQGAFKNAARLMVRPTPEKLYAMSTGLMDKTWGDKALFQDIRKFGKLRNLGAQSIHLCLVAEGALAFAASIEARLWDDAAGRLIASEAGAQYLSYVPAGDLDRPSAKQRSIAVHSSIAAEVASRFKRHLSQEELDSHA